MNGMEQSQLVGRFISSFMKNHMLLLPNLAADGGWVLWLRDLKI
jgi:hypothetical protein